MQPEPAYRTKQAYDLPITAIPETEYCCHGTITLQVDQLDNHQRNAYGTTDWATDYAGRNPVEGVNGMIKNDGSFNPASCRVFAPPPTHSPSSLAISHPQPRPNPTSPPSQAPRQHHRPPSRTGHPRHHPTRHTNPTHGRSHTHPGTPINHTLAHPPPTEPTRRTRRVPTPSVNTTSAHNQPHRPRRTPRKPALTPPKPAKTPTEPPNPRTQPRKTRADLVVWWDVRHHPSPAVIRPCPRGLPHSRRGLRHSSAATAAVRDLVCERPSPLAAADGCGGGGRQ